MAIFSWEDTNDNFRNLQCVVLSSVAWIAFVVVLALYGRDKLVSLMTMLKGASLCFVTQRNSLLSVVVLCPLPVSVPIVVLRAPYPWSTPLERPKRVIVSPMPLA
jgi:hypothetical protein